MNCVWCSFVTLAHVEGGASPMAAPVAEHTRRHTVMRV